jgi:hypothetical protein
MSKLVVIAIFFLVAGYILGHLFPFPFWDFRKDISGRAELRVVALTDKGQPVEKLSIVISRRPRTAPDVGGEGITDKNGLAVFKLRPGKYYLGLTSENIPKDLDYPTLPSRIEIKEGVVNEQKITLFSKETEKACTMEAKQCPDGSSVGRVPPNCDFAPCPEAKKEE